MPQRLKFVASTAAVALIAVVAAAAHPAIAQSEGSTLEGTWRVEITLRDCTSGQPLRAPFPALASFARGGTVTTADGGLSPAMRTTGLGVWWHAGGGAFAAVTEAYLFAPGGANTGIQRITQQIEVDRSEDTFQASVNATTLDPQGTVVGAGCATSVGRRLN